MRFLPAFFIICTVVLVYACRRDLPSGLEESGYPNEIGKIILTHCAVTGCHNAESKAAAGGLDLESWESMFRGGSGGATVIPFSPDFSTLMYYVNTYDDLGPSLNPTMPLNNAPLSRGDVELLKRWIAEGAPDRNGFICFSDNISAGKYFISNQGCDAVAVFDKATDLCMRYISVGKYPNIETPHMLRLSPDGVYFYVIFSVGNGSQNYLQKFSAESQLLIAEVNLGQGSWNTLTISADGRRAYVVDWSANGGPMDVNLETMSVVANYQGMLIDPHGSTLNGSTLYITMQAGNGLYKMDTSDIANYTMVSLDPPNAPDPGSNSLRIHELAFSPDGSKYFVTCQGPSLSQMRIFQTSNDSLLAVIPLGAYPSEMAVADPLPYVFVTVMEDVSTFPGKRGSVAVINYQTHQLITSVYTGHQPHGIGVSNSRKRVYVANRNLEPSGPAPHHSSLCGGRNGYLTIIDMNTMQLVPGIRTELSSDPYSVGVRE
ncbi:MAG: hypothetical protein IT233_06945 [Bacteroidia bacterium]|nr:hypothetical protein [Bacteroidia bacterium]